MAREHLQILLIEDNHADAKLIRELLAEVEEIDVDMDWASSLSLGLERYAGGGVDVVLLDLALPDSQGLDTLRAVHSRLPDAAVVVLTGLDHGKLALAALHEGAQDYLVKSQIGSVGLVRSMRYAIERKRIEEELKLRTAVLSAQFELCLDGILVVDEHRRIVQFNRRFADLWKIPLEVLEASPGRRAHQVICPRLVQPRDFYSRLARRDGERHAVSIEKLVLKDGRTFECRSTQMFDADERYCGQVWYFRDVTERKRAEEALGEREEKFRNLFNNAEVGMFRSRLDGSEILDVNDKFLSIFGRTREETIGKPSVILWADPQEREEMAKTLEAKGHVSDLECRLIKKDGEVIECIVSFRHYPEQGTLEGSLIEITERKRAEKSLRESKAQLQSILDNSGIVVFLKDLNGRYIMINRRFEELFHVTRQAVVGKSDYDIFPQQAADKFRQYDLLALENGGPVEVEETAPHDDGVHTYISIKFPLFGEDGKPYGVCGIATDITERRRVQEQIEQLSRFASENPNPVLRVSAQGVLEYANAAANALLPVMGAAVGGTVNAEWQALIGETLAKGRLVNILFQAGDRTFGATLAPISGRDYVNLYAQDITDHKRDEGALRESEERFRTLFSEAPIGVAIDRPDDRYIEVNDAFCGMLGYSKEELLSKKVLDVVHPDDRAGFLKANSDVLAGVNSGYAAERRYVRRDGSIFFGRIVTRAVHDREGKCRYRIAMLENITERKRAEAYQEMGREVLQILNEPGSLPESFQHILAALKTRTAFDAVGIRLQEGDDFPYFVQQGFSKDFLLTENTLIEHASDGSVCLDKEGKISLECACGLVISGKTDPANPLFTPGGSCWTNDSFPPPDIPPGQDPRPHPRDQCRRQGYASVALVPIRSKDRVVGLIQLNDRRKGCFTLDAVRILEGIAAHIGAALMRRQAEDERAKIEDQLRQAQKMESIGRLAGGVAHDFNNILTGVGGYTELVLDRLDAASPLREDLQEVQRLAKRASDLTQQLLAFSRRQPLEPRILNLNDTVADAGKMLKRMIGEDIDFHFAPAPDLGNIRADPGQIVQILMNLVVNSRDAMPTGGKLTIETANIELDAEYTGRHVAVAPGPYVMLAVSDTGCGMDAATKERIFEPFFTTKEKGKGTGLGLATVYGIVKQHGGNIWVYSEPGKGATFKIYLPRVAEAVSDVEPAVEPETARCEEMILVVEDEAPVYAFAERVLKARGYGVAIARSAEEAERVFSEQVKTISLLLTDVVLPGMNGRVLYNLLKGRKPDLKVLYMSGYTDNAIVHQGVLDAGITFIQKPFTTEMLARKVRQVLDS